MRYIFFLLLTPGPVWQWQQAGMSMWNRTHLISKGAAWKHRKHGRQVGSRSASWHGGRLVSSCFVCADQQSVCVPWQTSLHAMIYTPEFPACRANGCLFSFFSCTLRVTGIGFLTGAWPSCQRAKVGSRPRHDNTSLQCRKEWQTRQTSIISCCVVCWRETLLVSELMSHLCVSPDYLLSSPVHL